MNGLWRFCQGARICRTSCSFRAITSQSSSRPRFHVSENIEMRNMTTFLQRNHNSTHRWMSTKVEAPSAESLSQNTYEQVCSETLEALFEYFDNLIESTPSLKSADITYGVGPELNRLLQSNWYQFHFRTGCWRWNSGIPTGRTLSIDSHRTSRSG